MDAEKNILCGSTDRKFKDRQNYGWVSFIFTYMGSGVQMACEPYFADPCPWNIPASKEGDIYQPPVILDI